MYLQEDKYCTYCWEQTLQEGDHQFENITHREDIILDRKVENAISQTLPPPPDRREIKIKSISNLMESANRPFGAGRGGDIVHCNPVIPMRIRRRPNLPSTKYVYIKSTTVYVPSSELGLSQALSRQRRCPSPQNSPAGDGLGESQFRRLEKKISTLPTLCCHRSSGSRVAIYEESIMRHVSMDEQVVWNLFFRIPNFNSYVVFWQKRVRVAARQEKNKEVWKLLRAWYYLWEYRSPLIHSGQHRRAVTYTVIYCLKKWKWCCAIKYLFGTSN